MNLFWSKLQPLLKQLPDVDLEHWQYLQNNPSLSLQLIEKTCDRGAVYLTPKIPLAFSPTTDLPLSANQQIALNLAAANNPLMVIQGVPGSGKTRLAGVLTKSLIKQQKSILILTNYPQNKSNYQIQNITFSLSNSQDYNTWLTEQIKRKYLGKIPMDFLPLHLLPDALLAQLRSPQKLEKWLHILQANYSLEEIKSLLSTEFPQVSNSRLDLLTYRLQKLVPLLEQQLWLHQLSQQSEAVASAISAEIKQQNSIPILGTVGEFLQHQQLWKKTFDCAIVESAEYLSWSKLVLIAGVAKKLILLGNLPLSLSFPHHHNFSQSSPFEWLGEFLLPTYRYRLTEQFRLHSTIARPIFDVLYGQWIRTQPKLDRVTLPQARLQVIDVRGKPLDGVNSWEGKRLLKFMSELGKAQQIGILAFTEAQKTWLQNNCTSEYRQVFIGSFADWVDKEIEILLISCVGYPQQLTRSDLAIALTRASDYLILFADYQLWSSRSSPMQNLLSQPELQITRIVEEILTPSY
ncbi:MAG: hypothetical protein QNJ53_30865 [Pleurocapsa sp. MO_192.B19]|nr:hypothetical protein [Pleurocapsa sp. MO_192.B19]